MMRSPSSSAIIHIVCFFFQYVNARGLGVVFDNNLRIVDKVGKFDELGFPRGLRKPPSRHQLSHLTIAAVIVRQPIYQSCYVGAKCIDDLTDACVGLFDGVVQVRGSEDDGFVDAVPLQDRDDAVQMRGIWSVNVFAQLMAMLFCREGFGLLNQRFHWL